MTLRRIVREIYLPGDVFDVLEERMTADIRFRDREHEHSLILLSPEGIKVCFVREVDE